MRLYATTAPPQPLPPPPLDNPLLFSVLDGLVWPAVFGLIVWINKNSEKRRSLEYQDLKDDNRETREKLQETRDELHQAVAKLNMVSDLAASLKVLEQRVTNIHIAHTQDQATLNQLRTELIQLQTVVEQGYASKDLLFKESMSLQAKLEDLGRKLEGRDR